MIFPLPMPPVPDASEQEWTEYINELTLEELIELVDYFESLVKASRKRELELQSLGAAYKTDDITTSISNTRPIGHNLT
jgi:hypothetical protein